MVAEADAKLAACAPGAAPTTPAPAEKEHHAKAKAPKAPVAPPSPKIDTAAPVGSQTNPIKSTKTGGL